MDEYEIPNVTFVTISDDEERNARPSRDHRTTGLTTSPGSARRPRRVVIQGGGSGREPVVVRQVASEPVVVRQYPTEPAAFHDRRLFGNLTTSEAVEVASQILASLQPLPNAPVATGKLEIDVENLTLYHAAVALHFKRDEQLRTIGSLLSKLMS